MTAKNLKPSDYLKKILNARVYDVATESALEPAKNLSKRLHNTVLLKREDQQAVHSFKLRGAYNKMAHLTPAQLKKGVICASAGNHAQGVALGASKLGCRAVIVMPTTTPQMKIEAVKALGAEVVLVGDSYSDAFKHATMLEKKLGMTFVHPFDDPEVAQDFLCLPDTIRQHVERDKRAPAQKAVDAQLAAAIALLQAIPIRIANLAAIDLNRHMRPQRRDVHLVISEAETKNRQPIDFNIPPYALDIVRWYIRDYRPFLMSKPTDALFPGRGGQPKSAHTLGVQIKKIVFKFTGLAFNVHLFRHFAGKVFLDQQPGSYEIVRQVLGHKRIDTTTSFYSGAEVQRASTVFNQLVDDLRGRHSPSPAQRQRRRT